MADKVLERAVFENILDDEQEPTNEDKANQKLVDELDDDFSTTIVVIIAIIGLFGLSLYWCGI